VNSSRWSGHPAAALLGVWEGLSGPIFDPFWLSRPSDVVLFLWKSILFGQLISDLSITFQATAIGYVFGAILGLAFGLALAQSETVALVLKPFILVIYGIPRIALASQGIGYEKRITRARRMYYKVWRRNKLRTGLAV